MAHPLRLSYNWQLPLTFSSLGLSICLGVLLPGRRGDGSGVVAVVLVLLWAGNAAIVWARTRAYLMVDGPQARVRTAFGFSDVDGRQVTAVRQRRTPSGTSHRLRVRSAAGTTREVSVPTSLLQQGDQTLFAWILAWAPGAAFDRGSSRTMAQLTTRGLLAGSAVR